MTVNLTTVSLLWLFWGGGLRAATVANLTAYPPYPGAKPSAMFAVTVNGQPVFVHDHPTYREQGSGDMHYAHFAFTKNPPTGYAEDLDRPLENFTFKHCTFEEGGGIYISGGASVITGFQFEDCTVYDTRRPCILSGKNVAPIIFGGLRIGHQLIKSAEDFTRAGGQLDVPANFAPAP